MSKEFREHLKVLRLSKTNLTQEQMAKLLDTDLQTYERFENGELDPSMHRIYVLIQVLGIDFKTLFDYEEDTNICYVD